MSRSVRAFLLVAGVTTLVAATGVLPALADPSPRISNVYQLPCRQDVCDESRESPLADGGLVDASIQVHVSVSSATGLQWVQLRARYGADDEVCLRHWDTSQQTFNAWVNFTTLRWPGQPGEPPDGCAASDSHGTITRNGTYYLRVVARDGLGTTASSDFSVKANNAAGTPSWAAQPRQSEPSEGEMELRWHANPESDVVEYRWTRSGPDEVSRYEVNAARPEGQGCEVDGSTIVCWDDDFPARGYDGTYTYELTAWRRSPAGSPCRTAGGDCIGSAASDPVSGRLDEPPPPEPASTPDDESPTPRGTRRSPPRYDRNEAARVYGRTYDATDRFYFGRTFEETLPYDAQQGFKGGRFGGGDQSPTDGGVALADQPSDASDPRRVWVFLASGLLLLVGAVHLSRLARNW